MPDREMLPSPPSGLCACRLGEYCLHIWAISPRCVIVRLPDENLPSGSLTLHIFLPEEGRYEAHAISNYTAGKAQHLQDAVLFRLCFDDAACARAIRHMMNTYARCLETKSTLNAAAWAGEICGYPAEQDDVFFPDLVSQMHAFFDAYPSLPEPDAGIELAVELNCPELWQAYLAHPLEEFMDVYAHLRCLRKGLLPRRLPERIYIGNAFCSFLFPDAKTLDALCCKADAEGLCVTITIAQMRTGVGDEIDKIIAFAQERASELMVNDWGVLHRAAGKCAILLGPLLNKRRKDPRFPYKPGTDMELLRQNSLHSDAWRNFLAGPGVHGYAWENAPLPIDLPEGINCLHLPFYQTNTSHWCPLQAMCMRAGRGKQQPSDDCAQWCRQNVLLYPVHLKMLGKWNSLFALGDLPEAAGLVRYNRWVLNF